ncbi:hypothetical protein KKF03_03000 [Patescibacteria group bacterium]|nr:hypothetical protein [Patescibacteria group bacterium]
MKLRPSDIEVKLKEEHTRAIIEGRTSVPFKTFVALVLQRKVIPLLKQWGDEPIIIHSELLTSLASAPQDSQENRSKLVLVTMGVGVLVGIFFFAVSMVALETFGVGLGRKEFLLIAGGLVVLALLVSTLGRVQRMGKGEKLADKMEKIASLLSK